MSNVSAYTNWSSSLESGLAYWFEANSAYNKLVDLVGNSNATFAAGTSIISNGPFGRGYMYINGPGYATLTSQALIPTGTSEFTYLFDVNNTGSVTNSGYFSGGTAFGDFIALPTGANDMYGYIGGSSALYGGSGLMTTSGRWRNVVWMRNASGEYLFSDGVQRASLVPSARSIALNTFRIGTSETTAINMTGGMTKFAVWNRGLNASDILLLNSSYYRYNLVAFPVINLVSPINYYNTSSSSVTFNCSANGTNMQNISLFINGIRNYTLTPGPSNYTSMQVSRTLGDGVYNWSCEGVDSLLQVTLSNNNTLMVDTTKPSISIIYPLNKTTSNNIQLNINYTVSDVNLASCWYTNNSGLTNNSLTCGQNITGVTWIQGSNNVTIYANDSVGNTNFSSVYFFIDSIFPAIQITYPANNTNTSITNIQIDYIVSDTNLQACWFSNDTFGIINYSLGGAGNCVNITNMSWSQGKHNVTVYVNDTAGNTNFSSVFFNINTTTPLIHSISPINNSILGNLSQIFSANISSVTDIHDFSLYIWYSNGTQLYVNDSGGFGNASDGNLTFTSTNQNFGTLINNTDYFVSGSVLYLNISRIYNFYNFNLGTGMTMYPYGFGGAFYISVYNTAQIDGAIYSRLATSYASCYGNACSYSLSTPNGTYYPAGVASGSSGGYGGWSNAGTGGSPGVQGNGFGGGGGGGGAGSSSYSISGNGGNGGAGDNASTPLGGASFSTYNGVNQNGYDGANSGGGGGGTITKLTGDSATSASGGSSFSATGGNQAGSTAVRVAAGGGGGGAGGRAGISGINFIIKARIFNFNGTIDASGTNGDGGGAGSGCSCGVGTSGYSSGCGGGGGGGSGGGGNSGSIYIYYTKSIMNTGVLYKNGGTGGTGGIFAQSIYCSFTNTYPGRGTNGTSGNNASNGASGISSVQYSSTQNWTYNFSKDGIYLVNFYACNDMNICNWSAEGNYTLTIDSSGSPKISIAYPVNNTNSTNNKLNINYTVISASLDSCWYSNDSYSINLSLGNGGSCVNITNITWSEGSHDVRVYANRTIFNQINSTSVHFAIDSIAPSLIIASPLSQNYNTNTSINLNYTTSDSGLGISNCRYNIINSTGGGIIIPNTTITNCLNTTFSVPYIDNDYNATVCVNDTVNNLNCSSVKFGVRLTVPSVVSNYPPDNKYFNYSNNIYFNCTGNSINNLSSARLYGDWNGSFSINETFYPVSNGVQVYTAKNLSEGNNYHYNCWFNDSFNNQAFSISNRTFSIDLTNPTATILYINQVNNTQNILFNVSSIDNSSVSCFYTIYNSTGSIDGLNNNTPFTCNQETSATTTLFGTFSLNISIIDAASNSNSTSKYFTLTAGGGGSTVIISGGGGGTTVIPSNWTITTETGNNKYEILKIPGISRTYALLFENLGEQPVTISLQCADISGTTCSYTTFANSTFNLNIKKKIKFYNSFTIAFPSIVSDKEEDFNIVAKDATTNPPKYLTVSTSYTNIITRDIVKLTSTTRILDLNIPIYLIFFVLWIAFSILTNFLYKILFKVKVENKRKNSNRLVIAIVVGLVLSLVISILI